MSQDLLISHHTEDYKCHSQETYGALNETLTEHYSRLSSNNQVCRNHSQAYGRGLALHVWVDLQHREEKKEEREKKTTT
jgi:hypothetical protein